MKVTLRERNQGGKTSLYLDYYHRGKRKTEYLKLYHSKTCYGIIVALFKTNQK